MLDHQILNTCARPPTAYHNSAFFSVLCSACALHQAFLVPVLSGRLAIIAVYEATIYVRLANKKSNMQSILFHATDNY